LLIGARTGLASASSKVYFLVAQSQLAGLALARLASSGICSGTEQMKEGAN
jgi:hypothetical protein